jgi:hypothetical protein
MGLKQISKEWDGKYIYKDALHSCEWCGKKNQISTGWRCGRSLEHWLEGMCLLLQRKEVKNV